MYHSSRQEKKDPNTIQAVIATTGPEGTGLVSGAASTFVSKGRITASRAEGAQSLPLSVLKPGLPPQWAHQGTASSQRTVLKS